MSRTSETLHENEYDAAAHRTCSKEVTRAEMGASVCVRGMQQISTSVIRPDQKLEILLRMSHAIESSIMDIHFNDHGDMGDEPQKVETIYPVMGMDWLVGYFPEDNPFEVHRERLQEMRRRHVDFGNSLKEHTDGT